MRFHPEVLGAFASKGFVLLFFEVLYIRTGFYFFDNVAEVNLLDIIAYCTYLFVLYVDHCSAPLSFSTYALVGCL